MEQIGEGGMGLVFVAEQQHPVRRKVALKVIKPGMDTRQVVARFEAERQALALMDHPNIAKVLDGGETAGGQPYFVMELVKGVPITEYCDQNRVPIRERLGLFAHVCQAVQHAHQKGVIHRDIKPSNVLVVSHDGTPVVKVIDFGVAKAVGQQLTEKTIYTQFTQMVGTPLYMSPEQAGQSGLDVDTRTDIYALGVLLYELLTGETPFDKERFRQAAYDEIRRIIREEEPPKPSTRISTLGEASATVSTQRGSDPKQLRRLVRGELDWIVMKALEKDRNRRYETANGLARDIERYLADEPVQACPPTAAYRLRKFARRNKAVFTTVSALGAGLVVAVVVLAISTVRIGWEKDRKEEALGQAQANEKAANDQRQRAADNLEQSQRRLFRAKVNEARASRRSRRLGQRYDSLKTLEEATRLARELGLPEEAFLELRNEVIACLALPDLRVDREWEDWPSGSSSIDFDEALERYARTDVQGNVTVRRVADDAVIYRLQSGIGNCWTFLSPDGRWLFFHTPNQPNCRLFSLAGREALPVALEESACAAHAFSPDGRQLALAHPDGGISLFDLPSGRRVGRLPAGPVPGWMAFHPDGRQLALACSDRALVRDLETGKAGPEFRYPAESWPGVAWHPDGRTLAVVAGDRTIRLWDVAAGKQTVQLEGFKNGGIGVTFNRAGDLLASAGWDGTLRLWDPRTGQQLFQVRANWPGGVPRFGPGDRLLAGDIKDGKVRLWEVAASRAYRTLVRDPVLGKGDYGTCAVSPQGRLLACGISISDGVAFWDGRTGAALDFVPLPVAWIVLFEASGALLTDGPNEPFRWPVRPDPAAPERLRIGPPQRLPLPGVLRACSPDGRVVVSAPNLDWGVFVWCRDRPGKLVRITRHFDVRSASVSPDGDLVATGSHWGSGVKVWEAATGRLVADLVPTQSQVGGRFSPDGKWLATYSAIGTCRLWAVGSWQEGPPLGVNHGVVAFSPDGKLLALETGEGLVRLLDPNTGREYARLEDPNQDRARQIAFSPDGTQLVATGEAESLHVWDLRAIRAELADRKLDWGLPPYPPAREPADAPPLRLAVDLGELADPRRDVAAATAALALLPVHPQAYLRRGRAWYRLREYGRAADDLGVALGLGAGGDDSRTWVQWASACTNCDRFGPAVDAYGRALKLDPENVLLLNNLAWLLATCPDATVRDPARAVALAKRSVELGPEDGNAWNTLGVARYRAGDWKETVEALSKSVELQKGGTAFDFFFLAMAHGKLGHETEARRWYDRAVEWEGKNRAAPDRTPTQAQELKRFRAEAEEELQIRKD
jgi:WD40 repeat protein/Tfp pilus assembly protein PilF